MMLNDTYPESWRKYVGRNIAKRGVSLVLNDRLEDLDPKEGFVTTAAGKRIPADLVVSSPLRYTFSYLKQLD
mgnify:CR=1 FL=1